MTALQIRCRCFCAIGWALRLAHVRRKRVACITRQHRDVVAFAGIESDLAGVNRGKSISGRIGPAGAVTKVAHCRNVLSAGRAATRGNIGARAGWPGIQHGLTAFARERSGAALGNEIHFADMEIHAIGRDGASCAAHDGGAAGRSNAAVGSAVRVDRESLVFFDDPAIVAKRYQSSDATATQVAVVIRLGIDYIHDQIAGLREDECHGRGSALPPLRVLRLVGKCVGALAGCACREPAIRVHGDTRCVTASARRKRNTGSDHLQRKFVGIRVHRENAG